MAEPDGVVLTGHTWGGEIWFSDGYTDYIRHFMEGIAAVPEWAPAGENHLLKSTSVVQKIKYSNENIIYKTYDASATEVLRLAAKPVAILVNGITIKEIKNPVNEGWVWEPLAIGGELKINHQNSGEVQINLSVKK